LAPCRQPVGDQGFGLRFYASTALRGTAGKAIGALCLVDTEPPEFGAREVGQLKKFAGLVQTELLRGR
jgi:hypothetical protein